jgi:hypothetical protein
MHIYYICMDGIRPPPAAHASLEKTRGFATAPFAIIYFPAPPWWKMEQMRYCASSPTPFPIYYQLSIYISPQGSHSHALAA